MPVTIRPKDESGAMAPAMPGQLGGGMGPIAGSAPAPVIRAPEGPTKRRPTPEEIAAGFAGDDLPLDMDELSEDRIPKKSKKKRKKPAKKKKNMGGVIKYARGGKVRGYGKARGGRPCKMVSMKGS